MRKTTIFLTSILILCFSALPALAAIFSDYATDMEKHWAKEYVWYLQRNGLVDGYPDGTFKPDQPVTRAEFTKLFIEVATNEYCNVDQVQTVVEPNFTVSQFKDNNNIREWAVPYIEQAVKYGYINGYDDGTFKPDAHISKVEALAIMGRTLNKEFDVNSVQQKFTDTIPEWALPAVAKANDYGLIEVKKDGLFSADTIMTRADIAKFLYIYYVGEDID